ncbi:hypothetical protein [Sphaerisporangium sp. TRM90804]|uniref:hypothetical protein n=1 Tax=Sphaerisporangium sp. TRM90804 TaxID=3031113 RepID=UPI0024491128|nr:hypothetical protein [Sphaerisporangium sp. TRM90804]MDH2428603.1 hypothetical protein [Sphaerisporangium sp. TRM90804]
MIYLSAILVVLAFGLLVAGVVTGTAVPVMWSIVVSVLSAVFLMIGALLRRHELFPSGGAAAPGPPMSPAGAAGPAGRPGAPASATAPPRGLSPLTPHPLGAPVTTRHSATPRAFPATSHPPVGAGGRPSPDSIVLVIPGRKRFHLPGCRQLMGRGFEELTYEEARDEGFTACTTCLLTGPAPGDAEDDAAGPGATTAVARDAVPDTTGVPGEPGDARDTTAVARLGSVPGAAGTRPGPPPSEAGNLTRPVPGKGEPAEKPSPSASSRGEEPSRPGRSPGQETSRPGSSRDEETSRPGRSPGEEAARLGRSPGQETSRPGSSRDEQTSHSGDSPGEETARPGSAASSSEGWFAGTERGAKGAPGSPSRTSSTPGATPYAVPPKPVVLPEAVSPFQAFKRPEATKNGPATPPPAKGGQPGAKPPEKDVPANGTPEKRTPANGTPGKGTSAHGTPGKSTSANGDPGKSASANGDPGKSRSATEAPRQGKPATEAPRQDEPANEGPQQGKPANEGPRRGKPANQGFGQGKPATPGSGQASSADEASGRGTPANGVPEKGAPANGVPERGTPAKRGSDAAEDDEPGTATETFTPIASPKATSSPTPPPRTEPAKPGEAASRDEADTTAEASRERAAKASGARRPGIVKVIPGTRRYHSSACPLVRGADPATLETMSRADAEAADLTHCSVCSRDD